MIKLIALDLDGTTLQNDHAGVSLRTKLAIEAAAARHILVVPVTGRIHSYLPRSITELSGINYAITSYGAVTRDLRNDTIITSTYIPQSLVLRILGQLPQQEYLVELWSGGKIYYHVSRDRRPEQWIPSPLHLDVLRKIGLRTENHRDFVRKEGRTIEKINLPFLPPVLKQKLWKRLSVCPGLFLVGTETGIEIMSTGASKADGLRGFCTYLNQKGFSVGMKDVLALGDSEGDMEMIAEAGIGIAMENACAELKDLSNGVTLRNDEDGVAAAIGHYVLRPLHA